MAQGPRSISDWLSVRRPDGRHVIAGPASLEGACFALDRTWNGQRAGRWRYEIGRRALRGRPYERFRGFYGISRGGGRPRSELALAQALALVREQDTDASGAGARARCAVMRDSVHDPINFDNYSADLTEVVSDFD